MNEAERRRRFITGRQLQGLTYAEAVAEWNGADEIADTFAGIPAAEIPQGEIEQAVADWKSLRRLGL